MTTERNDDRRSPEELKEWIDQAFGEGAYEELGKYAVFLDPNLVYQCPQGSGKGILAISEDSTTRQKFDNIENTQRMYCGKCRSEDEDAPLVKMEVVEKWQPSTLK